MEDTNAYVFKNRDGLYVSRSSKFLADKFDVELLSFTTNKTFVMLCRKEDLLLYAKDMEDIGFTPIAIF